MKFGHTLTEAEGAAPLEFQNYFIKYRSLKKILKHRRHSGGNQQEKDQAVQAEKAFLKMLYVQLKEVDRHFQNEAQKIVSLYEAHTGKRGWLNSFFAALRTTDSLDATRKDIYLRLAKRACWCRKYAELNYTALRKIAKKRDRYLGGRVGEEFMQACFRGEVCARAFMSPSLLAELAAIERIMLEKAAATDPAALPSLSPSATLGTTAEDPNPTLAVPLSHTSPAASDRMTDVDGDCMCAVCLDVLYRPVALSCGHVFCSRCAVAAAVGHQQLLGSPDDLFCCEAVSESLRPCPCCRTVLYGSRREKHSPFWKLTRLHHLEEYLKQRYPEEVKRRRQEDIAQQAALKAARRPSHWWSRKIPDNAALLAAAVS